MCFFFLLVLSRVWSISRRSYEKICVCVCIYIQMSSFLYVIEEKKWNAPLCIDEIHITMYWRIYIYVRGKSKSCEIRPCWFQKKKYERRFAKNVLFLANRIKVWQIITQNSLSNRIIYFDLRSKKTSMQLTSINHLEKQVYTNRWKRSSVWWHIFTLPRSKKKKNRGSTNDSCDIHENHCQIC